jgi:hypothetical protein
MLTYTRDMLRHFSFRRTFQSTLISLGFMGLVGAAACVDKAPDGIGRTRPGPGATVRYDLSHKPLPAIPLPNNTATWADPTSRTGLRVNASLVAPTSIEQQARARFSEMEGWGTFAPITVAFDAPDSDPDYADPDGATVDLANVRSRHQGDDYDFADDVIYVINLDTGVPAVLDLGAGNFSYTLRELDKYWANDTRSTERNLLFETIDETNGGAITDYEPQYDTDFDGVLDRPNFATLDACKGPDPECDASDHADYGTDRCVAMRRTRDQCVADELLTWYERETDTLIVRPLVPLDEMTRYAVVLTDRLIDKAGNAVKSPFEHVYHATQQGTALRVAQILDDPYFETYYGDMHGTGLDRVGFVWSFTTQPTVDDLKRLRDGLYGQGPFARWGAQYPPRIELQRLVGLTGGLAEGMTDKPDWVTTGNGPEAGCPEKADQLWTADYLGMRDTINQVLTSLDLIAPGPDAQLLVRKLDNVSHMVIGTFKVPYLLEGGPQSTDPNTAFNINYTTGEAVETTDTVQFWMVIPKETEQHQQPFDVNIFGHGYTSAMFELILYAGLLAEQGVATIGINAMGHGLVVEPGLTTVGRAMLAGACYAPMFDALTQGRMRDLNRDGTPDSGGDFWSSYLFHTRDGIRQSVLDHIQLVRIMRDFGLAPGTMSCRDDGATGSKVVPCDFDGDGQVEVPGDFDGDGVVDAGGPTVTYGTWGESLGGILSGIHGAIDAYVTSAVPGSGGGGLSDIGLRSFQGGVVEAVLLRIWGPLIVTVPAEERKECTPSSTDSDRCTTCSEAQLSLRWVLPDVNGTGEVEIACLEQSDLADTTVRILNYDNGEVRCARVDEEHRFRVGLPTSMGDQVAIQLYEGKDAVKSYDGCELSGGPPLRRAITVWGEGRFLEGAPNGNDSAYCGHATCAAFQGQFFGQGTPLTAPGEGFGHIRQTPELRRFLSLAQAALEPGDPISFAPYYALKPMTDPFGETIEPHAVLTLNTIGDQNVPLNAGIAFARASGALPFLRPSQAGLYPEYLDYVTPPGLYAALGGATPNQELIDRHVIEGITKLARHPASTIDCPTSANMAGPAATFLDASGNALMCYPTGCTEETEGTSETRLCFGGQHCDYDSSTCVANGLGATTCEEALWDADDLDEGKQRYFEQASATPHRLARLTASARNLSLAEVWAPRLAGVPFGKDADAWVPQPAPAGRLTALLDAYTVPEGEHTFINGNPCHGFDHGTYLTRLVARFFASDGTDLYYLSHPESHHCMAEASPVCDFAQ